MLLGFKGAGAHCLSVGMLLVMVAGCSQDPAPQKSKPAPQMPVTAAPEADAQAVPRKSVDYMAGLKNFRDESKAVTREELERSAKQVVQSAEASKAARADATRPPETRAATPAPVAATPAPAPAPTASAQPAPSRPASPPPEDTLARAQLPTAAAPAAPSPSAVSVISRMAPDFPRDAVRAGVDAGTVRARLSIDAGGNVTNVAILEARPARVFDRSVRDTLSRWKFNPGSDNRTYDTEIEFRR